MKTQDDLYFCVLAVVHLNTLKCPLQFYGFHCDFCSEPKKLFIITTGSIMKSIDLCIQFIVNFNEEKIYLNTSVNLYLITFSKSAESNTNLLCIAAEPHSIIWHHSYMVPSEDLFLVLCCSHSHLWEQI